ncbi:heme biosynthesis protein HemY [Polycladidibacter hongkongensis]|uniref:heme biosynthesis protein HemY n=1 Tax=Polycladidibacter hongkongensis TaxID=1647556 RepID=UPI00082FF5B0|nr:heme biosynthesis HemY N-terminal domain-containing protein [Pseudovibrio hongkongensis]
MIKALVYLALFFAVAWAGAWVADRPGVVTVDWQGLRMQAELMPVLVGLVVVVVLAVIAWQVFRLVMKSPSLTAKYMQRRRRDKGFDVLSQGLIALGAGNIPRAKKMGLEADKLLRGDEPAAKLLLAQASQLSGNSEESRRRFEAMLEDPRTKSVGLHGLFVEAEREQEPAAAAHFAKEALQLVPGLKWAGKAVLGYQAVSGNWEAALETLSKNHAAKLIGKPSYRRNRAVLLCARALELEDKEPERARILAVEAHGLAVDLVPAAQVAARLLVLKGDMRKASKVLEATWKAAPHPDIAEGYLKVRAGDSAQDRLKRAHHLDGLRSNTSEGALAVAVAALDARKFDVAREHLTRVLRSEPTQRAFLLMADLDELESGDQGRVREWLSRALKAPQDKVWVADGFVSAHWAPVSPRTGRLDAYRWQVPEGTGGEAAVVEHIDEDLLRPLGVIEHEEATKAQDQDVRVEKMPVAEVTPVAPAAADQSLDRSERANKRENSAPVADGHLLDQGKGTGETVEAVPVAEPIKAKQNGQAEEQLVEFPLHRAPDDPGVESAESAKSKDADFRYLR